MLKPLVSPRGPQTLPRPLRCILDWFIFSLLRPDDDFTQTLRKIASSLMLLCSPVPVGFAVWLIIQAVHGAPKYGPLLQPAFGLFLGLMTVVNFILVKRTKYMSDFHAGIVFSALTVTWTLIYLCLPDYDPRTTTAAVALACVLARPPFLAANLVVLFLLAAVSLYNGAFKDTGAVMLLFPGPVRPTSPTQDLLMQCTAMFCAILAIVGVLAQTAAHDSAVRVATRSIDMSNEVVRLLREYNTDGVEAVLLSYERDADVHQDLVMSFRAITRNLEVYRPHLPNYILMEEEAEASASRSSASPNPGDESWRDPVVPMSSISNSGSPGPSRRGSYHSGDGSLCHPHPLGGAAHLSDATFRGRVSIAKLDIRQVSRSDMRQSITNAFFESMFQIAKTYHAAVHATVGDVIVLSWNVTRRLTQYELKAAKFLFRVLKAARELAYGPVVCGVVFSGFASSEMAVSGASKQHTLLISTPWMEALDAALRLSRAARCGLIDSETNTVAAYEMDTRAVERLQYIPTDDSHYVEGASNAELTFDHDRAHAILQGPHKSTVLYELVGELLRKDDEWMYQLDQPSRADCAQLTKAFHLATSGQFHEVLTVLAELGRPSASPGITSVFNSNAILGRNSVNDQTVERAPTSGAAPQEHQDFFVTRIQKFSRERLTNPPR